MISFLIKVRARLERKTLVWRTRLYLRDCFRTQSPPRASELAARLDMSPVELSRAFAKNIGASPSAYLKRQQVEFAKHLLATTTLTTNEVAYRAGFGTRATFFRLFREFAGTTPRRFGGRR
jgi:transcriptional regulator GlxA family with amidase domain